MPDPNAPWRGRNRKVEKLWANIGVERGEDGANATNSFQPRDGSPMRAFGPVVSNRPQSVYQALMENREDELPDMRLAQEVRRAFDMLSEEDRFIVEARVFEHLTYEELGARLGCSKVHAWRLSNAAKAQLERCLGYSRIVRERMGMTTTTWEQGAYDAVMYIFGMRAIWLYDERDYVHLLQDLRDDMVDALDFESPTSQEPEWWSALDHIALLARDQLPDHIGPYWIHSLLCGKQRDYGSENINRFGYYGITVRLSDKVERLANLVLKRGADAANEALEDTLIDLIGYAAIAHMLNEGTFNLPLESDLQEVS